MTYLWTRGWYIYTVLRSYDSVLACHTNGHANLNLASRILTQSDSDRAEDSEEEFEEEVTENSLPVLVWQKLSEFSKASDSDGSLIWVVCWWGSGYCN